MSRPLAAISALISLARASERSSTSMCEVPAYLRVAPLLRGQQAISRTSKPTEAAQSATSMSGRLRERRGQEAELHVLLLCVALLTK